MRWRRDRSEQFPGRIEDVEDVFYTLLFSNNQFNLYEIDLEPGTYAMLC